jgi:Serine incorporator (Serinc)
MGVIASCLAYNLAECVCCMGCSCLSSAFNFTLSQATRVGHLLIILVTFVLAIVLGRSYPDKIDQYKLYTKINLSEGCYDVNECIYRQLIYRASFSLVLLFSLLAFLSYFVEFFNKGIWILKFGIAIGVFIGFWWVDNSIFNGWAEVARVLSFFWLLVQGLLFLDFAHDSHDMLMAAADDDISTRGTAKEVYSIYIILSVGFLTCSGVGLGYLFKDYVGCQLGLFYTILTLLMGAILTAVSLLNNVNKGLLTPCLMFAYSVFLCWYALLSSPNLSCNPTADSNWSNPQVVIGSELIFILPLIDISECSACFSTSC